MSTTTFTPLGPQSLITANTTAATGVQLPVFGNAQASTFMLINNSGNSVNIGWSSPTVGAAGAATAATPPTGNASLTVVNGTGSIVLPNATVRAIRTQFPNPFFSAFAFTANGNCYIVPGDGV